MIAAAKTNTAGYNPLILQKSYLEYRQQIDELAGIAWQITYTALWNTLQFSAAEINSAKQFISGFLMQGNNHQAAYNQLVQRVLLARQYVKNHPGSYIPVPSAWFNPQNSNGFAGTAKWFSALQQTRASLPQHRQALKNFADAVTKTIQSSNASDFHYWRNYFIQQKSNNLLNLYLSTIANYYHTAG